MPWVTSNQAKGMTVRNISFSLTEAQLLDGTKDVTRRVGWAKLQAGDRLRAVQKAMGLKKGEHVKVLGTIEVISARREALDVIDQSDVVREGFPEMCPADFVDMFCGHMGGPQNQIITRIEFRFSADPTN
jgi:hypothetical protein